MAYTLNPSIPAPTNLGVVSYGAGTEGYRVMWEDGSSVVHLLAMFGGGSTAYWAGVYVNTSTQDSALVTGGAGGTWRAAYHATTERLYIGTDYGPCSVTEFDVATKTTTVLINTLTTVNYLLVGFDDLIYWICEDNIVYSYDPTVGISSLKNYGDVYPTAPNNSYCKIGVTATHIYAAIPSNDDYAGPWSLFSCPIGGSTWTGWGFNGLNDKLVYIGVNSAGTGVFCRRVLADNSTKYYSLHDGTYTEISDPGIQPEQGAPLFCYKAGEDAEYDNFKTIYGYEVNFADLFPIKSVHESSYFQWRAVAGTWYETDQFSYTEPWTAKPIQAVIANSGTSVFGLSDGYNASINLDYVAGPPPTYLGAEVLSPYAALRLSNGKIVGSGYPGQVWIWDATASWTLNNSNAAPVLGPPPNPFFIQLPTMSSVLHYLTSADYDANGLVWIGGNTTRKDENYGNVVYYNPTTGDTDSVFDSWSSLGSEVKFASLCAANNRSLICVGDDKGKVWIVNAGTKAVDATPIDTGVGSSGCYTILIESASDVVMGVVLVGTTYRIFTFKPSTKDILVSPQALGVSGVPFGWTSSEANRRNWKLEKGPDGYIWMFVDNILYRIHPTTCVFEAAKTCGDYYKVKFAANNLDVMLYGNGVNFLYLTGVLGYSAGYSRGNYSPLPSDDADLETPYTNDDMTAVESIDGSRVSQSASAEYAVHEFKVDATGKSSVNLTWVGRTNIAPLNSILKLQIYNRTLASWVDVDTDNTTATTDLDITLTNAVDLTTANFKDASGYIACRVWQLAQ